MILPESDANTMMSGLTPAKVGKIGVNTGYRPYHRCRDDSAPSMRRVNGKLVRIRESLT